MSLCVQLPCCPWFLDRLDVYCERAGRSIRSDSRFHNHYSMQPMTGASASDGWRLAVVGYEQGNRRRRRILVPAVPLAPYRAGYTYMYSSSGSYERGTSIPPPRGG